MASARSQTDWWVELCSADSETTLRTASWTPSPLEASLPRRSTGDGRALPDAAEMFAAPSSSSTRSASLSSSGTHDGAPFETPAPANNARRPSSNACTSPAGIRAPSNLMPASLPGRLGCPVRAVCRTFPHSRAHSRAQSAPASRGLLRPSLLLVSGLVVSGRPEPYLQPATVPPHPGSPAPAWLPEQAGRSRALSAKPCEHSVMRRSTST